MNKVNILNTYSYNDEHAVVTDILETSFVKEISIALQINQVMKDHESEFPLILHVVKGNITIIMNEESTNLICGDLICITADLRHHIEANDNTLLRISLFINGVV